MGMVLLVRHGQAAFGADDYDGLGPTGVEQSRVLGRFLADAAIIPGVVLSGAMKRQRDTATEMAETAGWRVVPEVDDGWNEFDHLAVVARAVESRLDLQGVGDGAPDHRAFQRIFEEATARWTSGGHDDEYDEPWSRFSGRVREALARACARDGVSVVVTSGGPI